jgi:DNA-binding transcriptional MerR regulator
MLNIGEFARLGCVSPRMLRHYDELGLLKPARVDPHTGYRGYEFSQLARLHTLVALRDLGLGLDQIGALLDDTDVEQLRGMLRLRHAQIEQTVADEQARLKRVEAHLRALERTNAMPAQTVVVKQTQPVHLAEMTGESPGFGNENIGPVFERLVPSLLAFLEAVAVTPRMMIAYYDWPDEDDAVNVHVGFDIGDAHVPSRDDVRVSDLPVIEVASVVHRGDMESIGASYEGLVRWIEDSGYRLAGRSRELYLEWHDDDPDASLTELQMPISR